MHYLLYKGDHGHFLLFNVLPGDPARMMLDQNENSEQLALIKKKYGFDKPIATQYLYYINDLSPLSLHSKKRVRLHVFELKENTMQHCYSVSPILVIKTPYLRKFEVERKYLK
jgi:peptide/nickel transport system permease protein